MLESEEDEILLLKRDQSLLLRKPLLAALAWVMERVLLVNESGPVIDAEVTAPVPLPVRRPPRVVEPVPPMFTPSVVDAERLPVASVVSTPAVKLENWTVDEA